MIIDFSATGGFRDAAVLLDDNDLIHSQTGAADNDPPLLHIPSPGNEIGEGCFPGSRGADQGGELFLE